MRRVLFCLFISLTLLVGCHSKPVRHLASDAALIQVGQSTRQDVIRLFGEPNGHRTVSPGMEEYIYSEDLQGLFGNMPVVGKWLGPEGYEMILITLKGDKVADCEFRTFKKSDRSWMEDFTWEEVQ